MIDLDVMIYVQVHSLGCTLYILSYHIGSLSFQSSSQQQAEANHLSHLQNVDPVPHDEHIVGEVKGPQKC